MNLGNYLTYFKRLEGNIIFLLLSFFYAKDSHSLLLLLSLFCYDTHISPLLSTTDKS